MTRALLTGCALGLVALAGYALWTGRRREEPPGREVQEWWHSDGTHVKRYETDKGWLAITRPSEERLRRIEAILQPHAAGPGPVRCPICPPASWGSCVHGFGPEVGA